MNQVLHQAFLDELAAVRSAAAAGDVVTAFHHLERAHILGQRATWRHVHVHWMMLKLGLGLRDWREVLGQAVRILAAAMFSRIWVPLGNTGRANVSAVKPMPLPEDLRRILEAADAQ